MPVCVCLSLCVYRRDEEEGGSSTKAKYLEGLDLLGERASRCRCFLSVSVCVLLLRVLAPPHIQDLDDLFLRILVCVCGVAVSV